ncbi:uncharacterized protein METZ01_LOCUS271105, partial [marine metagenome]
MEQLTAKPNVTGSNPVRGTTVVNNINPTILRISFNHECCV